jgi:hypothetical protein
MREFTHVSHLACALRRVLPKGGRALIGIDGVDGSGKSPLAFGLAERIPAKVVSLDRFLNRNRGSYVQHLRRQQLRKAILSHQGTVIVEGVCLRSVLRRLRLRAFRHVYVKAVSQHGFWSHEGECELQEPVEAFLEKEREDLRVMANFLASGNTGNSGPPDLCAFRKEVIRYHASISPSRRAHFVFLRRPVMPNNALQRTRRKRRSAELERNPTKWARLEYPRRELKLARKRVKEIRHQIIGPGSNMPLRQV